MIAPEAGSADSGKDGIGHVVRGFGALAASQLVSQVIGFLALIYVARRVGASNLGAYTFALLLATYFGLFASVGIDYLAMRDIGQDASSLGSVAGETLLLQGILSVVLYALLVALAPTLVSSHEVQHLIPIVGLTLLTTTFTLDWALLALGRSGSLALWRIVGQVCYAALIPLLVIGGKPGIERYAWLNILGLAVTAAGVMWVFFRVAPTRLRVGSGRALLQRLRRSVPFGYSRIMIQIYAGVSTLMVGYLESTRAVGVYAVAGKLPLAVGTLATIWITVLFPYTARRLATEPRGFADDLGNIITAAMAIGAAVVVGALLCAGTLMTTLFGPAFHAASEPFALLAVAAALVLIQANFSNVLLAGGSQTFFVVTMSVAAALVILLNAILIPASGVNGAAVATILGEAFLTAATYVGVRRRLGAISVDGSRLLRAAVAVVAMAAAMYAARYIGGAIIQVGIGVATAIGAASVLNVFDLESVRG